MAGSDRDGLLATPIETVARGEGDLARIAGLAEEHEAIELIVGLPVALHGGDTASTADARRFAADLAAVSGVPVRLVDERLTTTAAQAALRGAGRPAKRQRSVIDQAAAVILLQHALDTERGTGRPPGAPAAMTDEELP